MFANPLGLLALMALPAILGLHVFRRRFRPHVVSAVFLWHARERTPLSGRRRERLRDSPSLWLELAAALALAMALAGPRACGGGEARHLVVVLDASASMAARVDGASARERAVALVGERIDALPARSRVTLVASGRRPTVLAGPAAFPAEARARLRTFDPRAPRHELAPAIALGLELAGGAALLVVTDGFEPEDFPPEVELVALGRPVDNVAFTHVARVREREAHGGTDGVTRERVYLTVASYARAPVDTSLELASGGSVLETRALTLQPGERRHIAFDLPPDAPVLEARLAPDALAIDDQAWLAPVPPRTLALAAELAPETARALGLSRAGAASDAPGIERWLALVPDSVDAGSAAAAHLAIAERPVGGVQTWCLVLTAPGAERKDLIGPFLIEKRHPLVEGLTLEGSVWSMDPGLALGGVPLVSAGNAVLLAEERTGERALWTANLDPARSTMQRSPDWPILLANLAELRRAELPGPARTNLRLGEALVFRPAAELRETGAELAGTEREYVLTGPAGAERSLAARATLYVDGLEQPGLHRLSCDGRVLAELAVSFVDAAESDLRGLAAGTRASTVGGATLAAELTWIELALAAAALALVLGDAWFLRGASMRRITG
jgi:hypothetical protein